MLARLSLDPLSLFGMHRHPSGGGFSLLPPRGNPWMATWRRRLMVAVRLKKKKKKRIGLDITV
jgi:hypothetical protein